MFKPVLIVISALLLSACASVSVEDYRENEPTLVAETFFNGKLGIHNGTGLTQSAFWDTMHPDDPARDSIRIRRDMFFRVCAAEEEGTRVLNYAPGPLDTDMVHKEILEGEGTTKQTREMFEVKKVFNCV